MRVFKHDPERVLVQDGKIDLEPRQLRGSLEQRVPALDGARQRGDIPALLPSALGHLLDTRKSHRVRHSESSSSNSSTSSSAGEDSYDEDGLFILYGANTDAEYYAVQPDYLATDTTLKLSPSFLAVQHNTPSSLVYTHRLSTTNTEAAPRGCSRQ